MIKGMKGVKLLGLSDHLDKLVARMRSSEISAAFQYRQVMTAVIVLGKYWQAGDAAVTYLANFHSLYSSGHGSGGFIRSQP